MVIKNGKFMDKFFLLFLFINPLLDIISGYLLNSGILSGSISFSLIVRMGVLLLMGAYILLRRDWRSVMLLIPIGLASVLSIVTELICQFDRFSLFNDVQYIAKFIYNLAAFIVYYMVLYRAYNNKGKMLALLDRAFVWMAAWVSGSILLTFILRMGFSTYINRNMGAKGFFFSGNEATALLIVVFPLLLRLCIKVKFDHLRLRDIGMLLVVAMSTCALMLIGTKTSYAALILSVSLISLYVLVECVRKKSVTQLYALLTALGMICTLYMGLELITENNLSKSINTSTDSLGYLLVNPVPQATEEEIINGSVDRDKMAAQQAGTKPGWQGRIGRLLSGRTGYLEVAFEDWSGELPLTALFGVARGSRGHTIEMDVFEIFFYYGLFGFFFMCWPYVRQACGVLKRFFKRWDFDGYCAVIAIATMTGYLFFAGHVLFTVTGGFYYVLVILYACIHYDVSPMALPRFIEKFTNKLTKKLPAAKA